jgi:biopolymer transport protein ExbB/TolQ
MSNEEIAVIAIVFGSVVTIVFLGIVGGLIKTWIKSKNTPEDVTKNKEFLSALRDFKEKTERRIANLEAIVTEERQLESKKNSRELKSKDRSEHSRAVEIEMDDESKSEESGSSGKLRNMLNQ